MVNLIIRIPRTLCSEKGNGIILIHLILRVVLYYPLCMYTELFLFMFELYQLKLHICMYYLVSYVSVYVPYIFTIGHTQVI